jgi:hypothetical protein
MEQEEIRSIKNIIDREIDEFDFSWNEHYFYPLLKKYKDNVVAYLIEASGSNTDLCYILLKGKIKYFCAVFSLDLHYIKRVQDYDLGDQLFKKEIVITNKELWDRFEKQMIVYNLENNPDSEE